MQRFETANSVTILLASMLILMIACKEDDIPLPPSNSVIFEKQIILGDYPRVIEFVEKREGGYYALSGFHNLNLFDQAVIMNLNEEGDTLWTRRENFIPLSITETTEGGCLVLLAGKSVNFNADGTIKVEKPNLYLNCPSCPISGEIISAHDGGYVLSVLAHSPLYPRFSGTTLMAKVNENLEKLWSKTYDQKYRGLEKFSDGYAMSLIPAYLQHPDFSFSMFDKKGDLITSHSYGDSDTERISDLHPTEDGGFLVAGAFSWATDHAYLIRTNTFGETLWEKEFYNGVHDRFTGVVELGDKDIVLLKTGSEEVKESNTSPGKYLIFSKHKIYLLRLNENGEIKFQTEYTDDRNDSVAPEGKLIKTKNGYAVFMAINGKLLVSEFSQ
jgi:hypothetical protein